VHGTACLCTFECLRRVIFFHSKYLLKFVNILGGESDGIIPKRELNVLEALNSLLLHL
jgi:hypothetical protein